LIICSAVAICPPNRAQQPGARPDLPGHDSHFLRVGDLGGLLEEIDTYDIVGTASRPVFLLRLIRRLAWAGSADIFLIPTSERTSVAP